MSIADALVADFREEAENTRKVLAAVPDDRMDWKPHAKSMSLGRLAGHIAETPAWTPSMMQDELDFAKAGAGWESFAPSKGSELLERFEREIEAFPRLLSGKTDDFLKRTWTMRHGDHVLWQVPRHTAIRLTSIHHIVHHRGQLTVYLRLLGVPVPPTYGPTADTES
ncbi:MAG: DinB family protein [Candidatus Eiseniibacteriota bacterium]